MDYKNLVFEGGGVKGTAFAGAIQQLNFAQVERVGGASAGSIIATLMAVGYNKPDIREITFAADFKKFKDNFLPFRLFLQYGLYKGDYFLAWIEALIAGKMGKRNATFADLRTQGKMDLNVVSTSLRRSTIQIFNYTKTPDVIISEAVRASMSIPVFFDAFSFTQGFDPTDIFVDGGMLWNLPIELFDQDAINQNTLGFALWDYAGAKPNVIAFNDLGKYILALLATIMSDQSTRIANDGANKFRIIRIDDFGISATDFGILQPDKLKLYNSGIKYTQDYFNSPATT